uniref:Uncharacterized protein n=1 Tax=Peronospora matthiolae TaxID=2874970 RepID=A0AAV1UUU1_9STRA
MKARGDIPRAHSLTCVGTVVETDTRQRRWQEAAVYPLASFEDGVAAQVQTATGTLDDIYLRYHLSHSHR